MIVITLLGALNTVIAGLLALVKGQGLPDRLYHDQAGYRRLQDWWVCPFPSSLFQLTTMSRIEQTEALLSVGVIGRDRKEVGLLVQSAFKKYNAAKECEENNVPENYVRPAEVATPSRRSPSPSHQHGGSLIPNHQH